MQKERSNIILICIDTLRADHLNCYGYPRETSPNLNALAREGVLFENHISPAAHTTPSFTSIFTGQNPFHHGIIATLHAVVNERDTVLEGRVGPKPAGWEKLLHMRPPPAHEHGRDHRNKKAAAVLLATCGSSNRLAACPPSYGGY